MNAADLVVSKDAHDGAIATISEAIAKAMTIRQGTSRFVIYIKVGAYDEHVKVPDTLPNLTLLGDGMGTTIITGDRSSSGGIETMKTPTLAVDASGFIAQNLTIKNTAGVDKGQAVALLIGGDRSVVYRCSIEGFQDTLCADMNRQFYRDCNISGTVDFIFGFGVAVFQYCNIYVRPHPMNTITAHGRSREDDPSGFVIQNCNVTAQGWDPKQHPGNKTYLGRPWYPYARTVFMETQLDGLIDPEGWTLMTEKSAQQTVDYVEYNNSGHGAHTDRRVQWPGYKVITTPAEAEKFTVRNFIQGESWLEGTGVPSKLDL